MLLLLLGITAALLAFQYLKLMLACSYADKIKTIQPVYPIIGHLPLFCGNGTHEAFALLAKLFASTDRLAKLKVGPKLWIIVHHPELMQQVMSHHDLYDKPYLYEFFCLGNGLITERCCIGALLTVQYLKLLLSNRYADKIETLQPVYPIFGHIPLFGGKTSHGAFRMLAKLFASTDRMGKFLRGPKPWIVVNHPELMQQVMKHDDLYDKPFLYEFMRLGNGLITERSGDRWLQARKLLNPTLNTRMLTGFLPIMDSKAKQMIDDLKPLADGHTEIDIFKYISNCTLGMVRSTTMGQGGTDILGQQEYERNLEMLYMNLVGKRLTNVTQLIGPLYRLTESYRTHNAALKACNGFSDRIIRKRRQELEIIGENFQKNDEYTRQPLNTLDQVITIRKPDGTGFSDKEAGEHLYTMIGAANETSALTMSYTCLFMAMYPEIQSKVASEIDQVFYSSEVEINLDTLKQLEYTEMVIKEILRLFPAAPFVARQTKNDIQLDGVQIPKHQVIICSLYTLHHRKDIWGPDPERFDPDRFLPEAIQQRHPFAYLPFSGGLRNCIGYRYAMNSMKIMLLRILQNFELKTDMKRSDMKLKFEITLKLEGPHKVWIVERKLS